jgi:hypothetical protein
MAQEKNQETIFLSEQGVTVTNARFILPKQTFAMSGITSVQDNEVKPSKIGPIIFILFGFIFLLVSNFSSYFLMTLGVFMLIIGGNWLVQKITYSIILHTASGEVKALTSENCAWISKVVRALNDSIISRS